MQPDRRTRARTRPSSVRRVAIGVADIRAVRYAADLLIEPHRRSESEFNLHIGAESDTRADRRHAKRGGSGCDDQSRSAHQARDRH